ncbi:MAG: hypothetical protein KF878_35570 [Planctomycetes bacterium]|nr:hypothetical protein [Planctomycetota bacterium]
MDLDRAADLARALLRQGLVEEAVDALEALAEASAVPDLAVDVDDQARLTVTVEFDAGLVEALRRLPGAARDRAAGLWRVTGPGHGGLVDLLERLARPPCAPEHGCTLGGDAPPSTAHRVAHERTCDG